MSERGPRLQCQSRRVPFPCCQATAWPCWGLEHTRGAVLEKGRPGGCEELLYWSVATGKARAASQVCDKVGITVFHWNVMLANTSFSFVFLLVQSKNKVSLRNLSMVLRQLPVADKTAPGKQVLESVELARQAVQLDVSDGTSWCEYPSGSLEGIKLNKRHKNHDTWQNCILTCCTSAVSKQCSMFFLISCFFFCSHPGKCLCIPIFYMRTESTAFSTSFERLCTVCKNSTSFLTSKQSELYAPLCCCLVLTLRAPSHVGESRQNSYLLPGPSLQPVHPVPVRGDVWGSVGGLQPGCSSQPRLGRARWEGKAAARLLKEGHWPHGKQGWHIYLGMGFCRVNCANACQLHQFAIQIQTMLTHHHLLLYSKWTSLL